MLFFDGALGLVLLGLWVFCIIDVVMTPDVACRNLPKLVWLLVVLILPEIGSIVWLIAGRPWGEAPPRGLPYKGNTDRFPEYDRPGRQLATNPDDDEAFLAGLRERAEQQRRAAAEQRRAEERRAAQDGGGEARDEDDRPGPA